LIRQRKGSFLQDVNRENDSFAALTWVRTFSPGLVLTVSPFFHYNSANYGSSALDLPSATTENRSSKYEGGQASVTWVEKRNNLRAGLYAFAQQDSQRFGLIFNCPTPPTASCPETSGSNLTPTQVNPLGSLTALYAEDQIKVTSWLTLNGGLRQTHFSGSVVENATSPRIGASVRIPKLNWVFRGFYGHFYQAPPLLTLSGPLLDAANNQNLSFVPLHGERDEEHPVWRDDSLPRLDDRRGQFPYSREELFRSQQFQRLRLIFFRLRFRARASTGGSLHCGPRAFEIARRFI